MPRITISGVDSRVDGSYDLDLDDVFTGNELHLIKKVAGVRVAEIAEAMSAGDYDLIVCLTKIALDRNGKDVPIERLMDARVGSLTFEQTEAEIAAAREEDELPPASAPTGATESESVPSTTGRSSGNGSEQIPASDLPDTGTPAWRSGSASSQETLAS